MSYLLNFEKCRIVFSEDSSKNIERSAETLKNAIKESAGADIPVCRDSAADDGSFCEILVGMINRSASADTMSILEKEEKSREFAPITLY